MIHSFPISDLRISPELKSFFSRHSKIFSDYPNLWVKGGAARDALLNLFADKAGDYQRVSESPRDDDACDVIVSDLMDILRDEQEQSW